MRISDNQLLRLCVRKNMLEHLRNKLSRIDGNELDRQVVEFIKFMLIVSTGAPPGELPVSVEIDTIWHEWLLETREYEWLCRNFLGRFIHHSGMKSLGTSSEQGDDHQGLERDLYFCVAYMVNFGCLDKERLRYWPSVNRVLGSLQLSLGELYHTALRMATTWERSPCIDFLPLLMEHSKLDIPGISKS